MAEQSEPRTRRETMQRVQVGLIGLGAVLLVVAFANIVAKTIRPDASQSMAVAGQSQSPATQANGTDSEPLADLGVTPKSDQSSVGPSVPDLEPDPRLRKPMDQDPNKTGTSQRR